METIDFVPTDSYDTSCRNVLHFLINHAPSSIRARDMQELERHRDAGDIVTRHYIYFELPLATTTYSVTLTVDASNNTGDRLLDPEGGRWRVYSVEASVSWGSYGATDPKYAADFADFVKEIAAFAQDLMKGFALPIYCFESSKADRDAEAAARDDWERRRRVQAWVGTTELKRHLRVCHGRQFVVTKQHPLAGLPDGRYTVDSEHDREFRVTLKTEVVAGEEYREGFLFRTK